MKERVKEKIFHHQNAKDTKSTKRRELIFVSLVLSVVKNLLL